MSMRLCLLTNGPMALALAALYFGAGCEEVPRRPAAPSLERPVELRSESGPPVTPQCELSRLPEYRKERRYLAYDLNEDGRPEYFVENYAGVHTISFAVVTSDGSLLIRAKEVDEFGGDRLVILTTQHHGYSDIVCSNVDPGGVDAVTWRFNGRHYVAGKSIHYPPYEESQAHVDCQPGAARAVWYADIWATPEEMRPQP